MLHLSETICHVSLFKSMLHNTRVGTYTLWLLIIIMPGFYQKLIVISWTIRGFMSKQQPILKKTMKLWLFEWIWLLFCLVIGLSSISFQHHPFLLGRGWFFLIRIFTLSLTAILLFLATIFTNDWFEPWCIRQYSGGKEILQQNVLQV